MIVTYESNPFLFLAKFLATYPVYQAFALSDGQFLQAETYLVPVKN